MVLTMLRCMILLICLVRRMLVTRVRKPVGDAGNRPVANLIFCEFSVHGGSTQCYGGQLHL